MAAALIASGIDPDKSILFAQSAVPAHAELAWILQCTARMGWLNRMTQFKDKSGKNKEGASVGLFTYPVLQAADVLVYNATHVPVGEDQKQHIELARDIAVKFNNDFDVELFTAPEPFIGGGTAARVMSLRDGAMKMSKSDPSDMSRINLTDDDDAIAQKIRKARTDPEPLPDDPALLAARPEARNLVGVLAALTNETEAAICARFAGQGFGAFKPALTDALVALLVAAARAADRAAPRRGADRRLPRRRCRARRRARRADACRGLSRGRPAPLNAPRESLADSLASSPIQHGSCICASLSVTISSLKGLVFMRNFKLAAAFALGVSALALSGCATGFPAQVSRYQAMPAPQGQSFVVVPMDARAIGGLEFSRYAGMVAQAMQAQGYVPAASLATATMVVRVGYGVDQGTVRISTAIRSATARLRRSLLSRLSAAITAGLIIRAGAITAARSPFYYGWDSPFGSPFGYGGGVDSYTVYRQPPRPRHSPQGRQCRAVRRPCQGALAQRQSRRARPQPGRSDVHRLPRPLGRNRQDHRRRRRRARAKRGLRRTSRKARPERSGRAFLLVQRLVRTLSPRAGASAGGCRRRARCRSRAAARSA